MINPVFVASPGYTISLALAPWPPKGGKEEDDY
jgi:hypothetical protein